MNCESSLQIVTMERKVETKHHHRSGSSGDRPVGVRPTSPTRSPPVSPTHKGAEPTFELPQKKKQQQKKRKK